MFFCMQVAAAAASVGGGLAAVKGSLGSWGTYLKGQAENVAGRTGSPGLSGRGPSQTAAPSGPATAAAQGYVASQCYLLPCNN